MQIQIDHINYNSTMFSHNVTLDFGLFKVTPNHTHMNSWDYCKTWYKICHSDELGTTTLYVLEHPKHRKVKLDSLKSLFCRLQHF